MRIQPINSVEDFDAAIQIAENDVSSRWYVARIAQANGWSSRIPASWDESQTQITSFREYPENEQEAVSEHLSAVSAEVEDYTHNLIGMEDLEDAALAASIAAGEYAEQFETGLVASLSVYVNYDRLSQEDAEAIVAAAKKPRRVRTQAGVRRFKQPLHSIIMPGGKVLKPGDPGYDAADKAAGGSGSSSGESQPKARINTSSSKSGSSPSAPEAPTTKADTARDAKNTSGQRSAKDAPNAATAKPGAIGGPNDKAAAKLVRSKLSEISKAKTRDELRGIDLGELDEFVESNDVHDDVKKMVKAVSELKYYKGVWSEYRQDAANASRPEDVSSARNTARTYSARAKYSRDKINDTLDMIAGKTPAPKLEWVRDDKSSLTTKAEPHFKGDIFRNRSTGKYYANLIQDNQTILDREFSSEIAAQRAIEDKIKQTKRGMDAGKSPKVIDPEVVKAEKAAAKAEKAADTKGELAPRGEGKDPVAPVVPSSSDATPAERKRRATILVEELESEYGAADLSKLTDSELTEADNLRTSAQNLRLAANEATAPLEQKHREQLRDISRRIDEEMERRKNSEDTATPASPADTEDRASKRKAAAAKAFGTSDSSSTTKSTDEKSGDIGGTKFTVTKSKDGRLVLDGTTKNGEKVGGYATIFDEWLVYTKKNNLINLKGNGKTPEDAIKQLNDKLPAGKTDSTADRRADIATRASALGDKKMTPGRLNQRIRTVEKHLKGVEERIKARKARGLNPTKAQLRDQANLQGQLKRLNAQKSDGGSGKGLSPDREAGADKAANSPTATPAEPKSRQEKLFKALDDLSSALENGDLSADDAKKIRDLIGVDPFTVETEEDRLAKQLHNAVTSELQRQRSQSVEARFGRFNRPKTVGRQDRVPAETRKTRRDDAIAGAKKTVAKLREEMNKRRGGDAAGKA